MRSERLLAKQEASRHLMADHVETFGHRKAALWRDIDCEVLFD
jgi:hypothetical protein